LEAAIAAASFLDNIPGDDRQKLRGGCPKTDSLVAATLASE
jgi:hypothetical protein